MKPIFNLNRDSNWMVGLTSLEVYKSVLNITEKFNKFKNLTDTFDEFQFNELKVELEQILDVSIISQDHLQDKTPGPRLIETYQKLSKEQRRTDGY